MAELLNDEEIASRLDARDWEREGDQIVPQFKDFAGGDGLHS